MANKRTERRCHSKEHRLCITSVAIASGDAFIITGGYDGFVVMWREGVPVWKLSLPDLVNYIAISEDSTLCLASCADAYAYLLDARSGAVVRVLGPHADDVNVSVFGIDGQSAYTACDDKDPVIRVWSLDRAEVIGRFLGHESSVTSLALNRESGLLLSSGEDGSVRVWDTQSMAAVFKGVCDADPETSTWLDDSAFVTGSNDGLLIKWSLSKKAKVLDRAFNSAVRSVQARKEHGCFFAGTYDGRIYRLTKADFSTEESWKNGWHWSRHIAVGTRSVYASSFLSRPARIGDSGADSLGASTLGVNCLAMSSLGLLAAGDSGLIYALDKRLVLYSHGSIVNCLSENQARSRIASGDYLGTLKVYASLQKGRLLEYNLTGGPVNALVWRDDTTLYVGQYDGSIKRVNTVDGVVHCIAKWDAPIKTIVYQAELDLLIAGLSDSSIRAVRSDGTEAYCVTAPSMVLVNSLALSSDCTLLVSGSRDATVRIWRAGTGELLDELPSRHLKSIKAVTFIGDDQIASASYDGTVIIWDRFGRSWKATVCLAHEKPGASYILSAYGAIYSCGWDCKVLKWSLHGVKEQEWCLSNIFGQSEPVEVVTS